MGDLVKTEKDGIINWEVPTTLEEKQKKILKH